MSKPLPQLVLRKARALIATKDRWTKHEFARDSKGRSAPSTSPDAVCWCSIGALNRASNELNVWGLGSRAHEQALDALRQAAGGAIAPFNDDASHERVLAAFDKAIESFEVIL